MKTTFFVVATIINPLVMLNLLIAVMSDTYDRVRDGLQVTDHREMAQLIIEIETLLVWRRKHHDWKFIQYCSFADQSDRTDLQWQGKIREIRQQISTIGVKNKATRKQLDYL